MSDIKIARYLKEKVLEFDESVHRIGLEVIKWGHLDHGFSHHKVTFQLTSTGEQNTLIDVMISYDSETKEDIMPPNTPWSTLFFIKNMENYLMRDGP